MEQVSAGLNRKRTLLYRWARILALVTIFYNVLEGLVSVYFGAEDEALALFGFGLDSFVEVVSGIGIWHMINRMQRNAGTDPDNFERQALKITGTAFYILSVGLVVTALINIYRGHKPETAFWGIVISSISIIAMWVLIYYKVRVGRQLNSQAIIADANCSKACLYLSIALLASSAGYELTRIGGIDSAGAVLISWFSFKEGRESFHKAKGLACSCQGRCH